MPAEPRGRAARRFRLTREDTTAGGEEVRRSVSGPGVVIVLRPEVPTMKPTAVRRAFVRHAKACGVVVEVAESAYGHFTGSGTELVGGLPSAYRCVGPLARLREVINHFSVRSWSVGLNIRPPALAFGSGPEKTRPPSRLAFSRPDTRRSTADELVRQRAALPPR